MDEKSQKILEILRNRALTHAPTLKAKQLGEKVGLGESAIQRRVSEMRKAGEFTIETVGTAWSSFVFEIRGRTYKTRPVKPNYNPGKMDYGASEIVYLKGKEKQEAIDKLYLPFGGEFAYRVNR